MSAHELEEKGFADDAAPAPDPDRWWFAPIAPLLARPSGRFLGVLHAGKRSFFRLFAYALGRWPALKALALLALAALIALAVINRESWFGWLGDDQPVWTAVAAVGVPALVIAAYLATGTRGSRGCRPISWSGRRSR